MSAITLKAVTKKAERNQDLRADSKVPATIYGPKFESQSIILDYQEFRKTLIAAKLHTIITLDIEGKKVSAIIRDYQKNLVTDEFTHVDFYATSEDKATIVPVPVELTGESTALRVGGILSVVMPSIKVKCLPKNIPTVLKGDLALLKTDGDKIQIQDLEKVANIEIQLPGNSMVAKTELSRAAKQAEGTDEGADTAAAPTEAETTA